MQQLTGSRYTVDNTHGDKTLNKLQITVNDRHSYAASTKREYTDEGFLRVPGRVARTGVQEYLASELGITDREPNTIIKVYRPDESVFDANSLSSYSGADVTIEHPNAMVNAESYREVSVGVVTGPGVRDGDFVSADMIIKSKDAIAAVESGKVQLSAGYTAVYDEAPEDSPYDFIQSEIRVNHVALVDRARAGHQARLFDHQPGVQTMTVKVTLDSGRTIEVENEATATLVTDSIERLTKQAVDAEAKAETAIANFDAAKEDLAAEKLKTTDEAINARVEAITKVSVDACTVAGKDFTCDSTNVADIQRAALTVKRPTVEWGDKSDIYVQASFDSALEQPSQSPEQLTQFARDAANVTGKNTNDAVELSAYDAHKAKLANAYKGKGE